MKKLMNRQLTPEEKEYFKRNRKMVIIRSILLIGFLLVFNVFAWFIYISKVSTTMDLHVLSWDVVFSEGGSSVKDVNLNVDIYPGMDEYSYTLSVNNSSETSASLYFTTNSVKLFGQEMITQSMQEHDKIVMLATELPFEITYDVSSNVLDEEGNESFTISVNWDYEDNSAYFKVPSIFTFDEELTYYTKQGSTYTVDATVTSANYATKASTLYLQKDEIDSYIGEQCGIYQNANNKSCLELKGVLTAEQAENTGN